MHRPHKLWAACAFLAAAAGLTLMVGCAGPGATIEGDQVADSLRQRATLAEQGLPSLAGNEDGLSRAAYEAASSQPWWEQFDDEVFEGLLSGIFDTAFDARLAAARVREAEAILRQAGADRIPVVGLEASHGLERSLGESRATDGGIRATTRFGVTLDWQLDLFDRIGSSVRAAQERSGSSSALLRDTQRALVSRVARLYVQFRAVQQRQRLADESLTRRRGNVERINRLVQEGYGSELDAKRTQNQLYEALGNRSEFKSAAVEITNALAVIAGMTPHAAHELLRANHPLWDLPEKAPWPELAQILRQRPDLRALEHALAAAAYEVDASKAALYPSLDLGGDLLSAGLGTGMAPSLTGLSARIISGLAMPLLGRGRLLGAVDRSNARLDVARVEYERGVVSAVAEVDSALSTLARRREIRGYRERAAASASEAEVHAGTLFAAGELDYVSVIVAEQTRAAAEDAFIVAQQNALLAFVQYVGAVAPRW